MAIDRTDSSYRIGSHLKHHRFDFLAFFFLAVFLAHPGLKSDIAPLPKSATPTDIRSRPDQAAFDRQRANFLVAAIAPRRTMICLLPGLDFWQLCDARNEHSYR